MRTVLITAVVLASAAPSADAGCVNWDLLTTRAMSADETDARDAWTSLRNIGPEAIEQLTARYADELAAYSAWLDDRKARVPDPAWIPLTAALDAVGAQRDNFASRLFWHTDLEQAKLAATVEGKPILSLRLLGRLDEDLSCANSRFFRTVLYPNESIASTLREHFVLHWESVRPAPRITIDFGDGREICRTITGNSLHFVLDTEGRPIDAMPGLVTPQTFGAWLGTTTYLFEQVEAARTPELRAEILARHHDALAQNLTQSWVRAFQMTGIRADDPALDIAPAVAKRLPDAMAAAPLAISKAAVEVPVLDAITRRQVADTLTAATSNAVRERLTDYFEPYVQLDASSLRVMASKTEVTPAMLAGFRRAIAGDSAFNEFHLHRQIHEWFAAGPVGTHGDLTERIYAELFLTPSEDPWLGLLPPDTYAALDGNGVSR